MIKVRLLTNESHDVCAIIENSITNGIEIEEWIVKNIEGISFHCMDFPCDMEFCYDCYFKSSTDKSKAKEIYNVLKLVFSSVSEINFSIWVTDEMLNEIYKIGTPIL